MKIECVLKREGGSVIEMDGTNYVFAPDETGAHVAEVTNKSHIQRFLAISEGFVIHGQAEEPAEEEDDEERAELEAAFIKKFGKKPHHKLSTESIRQKLAE